ncbi:O-antigen translocase [Aeromonas sp. SG16]|uniref:O-antigen translocase n=1 Tax=Aeromonas sp. SG16 TaxID=2950548 RepID=UPI00210B4BA9|nr:O-antigen translocase [Aeromonas sp. SG16]MCQ4054007.1 O-antigen translocase [Aeromonas sp. SG16]
MKRLLKVTAMSGLLTLLRMGMGFVIAKVVAIYTGPTGMAMLGQIQSLVATLNGIINSPVGSGIVRYTAEKKDSGYDECARWWKASLQWVLIILTIVLPLTILFSNNISQWLFNDTQFYWVIIVTVIALPLAAVGTFLNSVINGLQNYRRYIVLGMMSSIVSGLVMLYMIMEANLNGALFAASVQSALIGSVMLAGNLRQPWFKMRYLWGKTEKEARIAIGHYMLMALTSSLTMPISLILVRNILVSNVGWEAAGNWQAVWKISEVYLGVITIALSTYYLPRLSSLNCGKLILKEISNTALIIVPVVSLLALLVYVLRDFAILTLFTREFYDARELFLVQLCGDIVKIASWLYAYPMISRGKTKWFISTEILFSVSFVILSQMLVHHHGVDGVNFAYLFSYVIYFIVIFFNKNKIVS